MTNASKRGTEMKELKYEKSFGSKGAEANEGTSMSTKDPDTMIGMTMLLLACIALAVLAHAVI